MVNVGTVYILSVGPPYPLHYGEGGAISPPEAQISALLSTYYSTTIYLLNSSPIVCCIEERRMREAGEAKISSYLLG